MRPRVSNPGGSGGRRTIYHCASRTGLINSNKLLLFGVNFCFLGVIEVAESFRTQVNATLDLMFAVDVSELWYEVFLSKYNDTKSSYDQLYVISSNETDHVNVTQTDIGVRIEVIRTIERVQCMDEGLYACGITAKDMNNTDVSKQKEFYVYVNGKSLVFKFNIFYTISNVRIE